MATGASSGLLGAQDARHAHAALAMGDTAFAIELLRDLVTERGDPKEQCLFATVLSRSTTSRGDAWRVRDEARRWFERSLKGQEDALCLLELASLLEKQGIRVDAGRVAKRAFDVLLHDSAARTPEALAEAYYRRALPITDWIRNFEHLVLATDLPVSTGNCDEEVLFCEAVLHPVDFRLRLERATSGESLVEREQAVASALLDSALRLVPDHHGALRLALRSAANRRDWAQYLALAEHAHGARPTSAGTLLTVLSALVMSGRYDSAQSVFDTLMERLGPDAMAKYEGLALVADTSLRERLAGKEQVVYGEAVWGLSDPLYLTSRNERRLAHYARIVLADVLFSDPAGGVHGRDTPQGRLVIRYGLPQRRFAVRADRRLQLTDWQRSLMDQILGCGTTPTYIGPRTTEKEGSCALLLVGGHSFDAGGRWEFWYYDDDGPPLIFERSLASRVAHHMFQTRSRELDSLLQRTAPSAYVPPYEPGLASVLVTGFPRPTGAVIEAWSRFVPPVPPSVAGKTDLGFFLHDATGGREIGRYVTTRPASGEATVVGRTLRAPWGTLRVTAEAAWPGGTTAAQTSRLITVARPDGPHLWLSDLLLGDSATAPPQPAERDDVRIAARTDSLIPEEGSLALYWESYGLTAAEDGDVHYRVRLDLQDAERRPLTARVIRSVGRALGLGGEVQQTLEWEVRRSAAAVVPDLVVVGLPRLRGDLRITLTVEDLTKQASATTWRVVTLGERTSERM